MDEVFLEVTYEPRDFVAARQLALIDRLREANLPQLGAFVLLAGAGVLFFAPDPVGRIFASLAGALVGLATLVAVWGYVRASAEPPKMELAKMAIEISDDGVVAKGEGRYTRLSWREIERAAHGRGVFILRGKAMLVVPERVMRKDQIETLRALVVAHESELGALQAPAAAPEQHDARGGERQANEDDRPAP